MLASMVALMFVGSILMFDPNGTCENGTNHHMPKRNTFGLAYHGERFLLFMLLISCCAASNLQNFIGLLAILWSILLLVHVYVDTRYVAKKFAACHLLALVFVPGQTYYQKTWVGIRAQPYCISLDLDCLHPYIH
jgi:hypothetical protein